MTLVGSVVRASIAAIAIVRLRDRSRAAPTSPNVDGVTRRGIEVRDRQYQVPTAEERSELDGMWIGRKDGLKFAMALNGGLGRCSASGAAKELSAQIELVERFGEDGLEFAFFPQDPDGGELWTARFDGDEIVATAHLPIRSARRPSPPRSPRARG